MGKPTASNAVEPPPPEGSQCAARLKCAPPSMVRMPHRLPPKSARFGLAGSTATERLYQLCPCPLFMLVQSLLVTVGLVSVVALVAIRLQLAPPSEDLRYALVLDAWSLRFAHWA